MKDYGISVLEQYDIDVTETRRVRNGVLVISGEEWYLLREMYISPERMTFLNQLYEKLEESQVARVDTPVANKEGEYLSKAEDGSSYLLRKWFAGRECDIKKESELIESTKLLAQMHQVMKIPVSEGMGEENAEYQTLLETYERHNRELRKIRAFVSKRSVKNAFEAEFLKDYDKMYDQAQETLELLRHMEYKCFASEQKDVREIAHGDYNYHNVLFGQRERAVTGFEHAHLENQLSDLYYYLRKILEKYRYDTRVGYRMLRAYDSVITLDHRKREYLRVRLAYPEKFWKIANAYYHSNKAWIPSKNVDKLRLSCLQAEERQRFIENLFT